MSKKFAQASTYPLQWAEGFPRTKRVESSRFSSTLFQALENVQDELRKFGQDSGKKIESVVISSNYSLTDTKPSDSGVCVYFVWDSEQTCIPVDRYNKVECNLQAIYHCITAKRTMLRHGGINLVKAAFRGYTALPPAHDDWRSVLNVDQSINFDGVKLAYKRMMAQHHPDKGGDAEFASKINKAFEDAKLEMAA